MLLDEHLLAVLETPPGDWLYRGEGNNSLVLALPKWRKILRIRKCPRPTSLLGRLMVWLSDLLYLWCWGLGLEEEESRDGRFYATVMRPLIGRRYTSEVRQVSLSRKQVKVLEREVSRFRPDFRKHKILQYGRASLFDDFAFLPRDDCDHLPFELSKDTFAIEIKPKQGWRPLKERHYPQCLYCMNQYLKMEHKQIERFSSYCPEDLFSGDDQRMLFAINSLIKVPQNNFRIFKNGNLVYNEKYTNNFLKIMQELFKNYEDTNIEKFTLELCLLIKTCLLRDLTNFTQNCDQKLFCEWNEIIQKSNLNNLTKGCVLEKILSVQMLDSEGSVYYSKLSDDRENLEDWAYVDKLLGEIGKEACLNCSIMTLANKQSDLSLAPYLISAIAKDCSLMITLKKIKDYSGGLDLKNVVQTPSGDFLFNLGVFDLYPKPLSTIKKHCQRNENMIKAYQRSSRCHGGGSAGAPLDRPTS